MSRTGTRSTSSEIDDRQIVAAGPAEGIQRVGQIDAGRNQVDVFSNIFATFDALRAARRSSLPSALKSATVMLSAPITPVVNTTEVSKLKFACYQSARQ
jgi:hypothetical protein